MKGLQLGAGRKIASSQLLHRDYAAVDMVALVAC